MTSAFATDTFSALRASQLSTELSDPQCRVLARLLVLFHLADGETLVAQGTSDNRLHVVVAGVLVVVQEPAGPHAQPLFLLDAGDLVGELSFLDGASRNSTVIARGQACVLEVERERLESLLGHEPRIVYHVMRAIVRNAHALQRRLSAQALAVRHYLYQTHLIS